MRIVGFALAAIAAALVVGVLVWQILTHVTTARAAADRVPLEATLIIPGLDEAGSRVPVRIEGTDDAGNTVSETGYLDWLGRGLTLKRGTYRILIIGSPINSQGGIYRTNNMWVNLMYDSNNKRYVAVNDLALDPIDPAEVTDAELAQAVAWAKEDPERAAVANQLEQAVEEERAEALAAQRAQKHVEPVEEPVEEPEVDEPDRDMSDIFGATDGYKVGDTIEVSGTLDYESGGGAGYVILWLDTPIDVVFSEAPGEEATLHRGLTNIEIHLSSYGISEGSHVTLSGTLRNGFDFGSFICGAYFDSSGNLVTTGGCVLADAVAI